MLEKYKPPKSFTLNTAYWVDIYMLDEVWGFSSVMQFQDIPLSHTEDDLAAVRCYFM